MKISWKTALLLMALAAGGAFYFASSSEDARPRPHERPVVRFIAKWAKSLLWLAMFAEEPPKPLEPAQQQIGSDGWPQISHARSL